MPSSKVKVGDFISSSISSLANQETTPFNKVTAVSVVVNNSNQNQSILSTITTAGETLVVFEHYIALSGKTANGVSTWVVEQM